MLNNFQIISPVDGSTLSSVPYATADWLARALAEAKQALSTWTHTPTAERCEVVEAFVDQLERRRLELARLVTWQMGRPSQQADEMDRVRLVTNELKALAIDHFERQQLTGTPGVLRFMQREPLGICLSICPWNYPVAMSAGLVFAPLLAGNVVLFKHSPQTALIADVMQECFDAAGGPKGVFRTVHIQHDVAEELIESGEIVLLLFIGSVRGGNQVHRASTKNLVRVLLELGGKDPAYVRPDADLAQTIPELINGGFSNSGQSCCSVERLYVHEAIYIKFITEFTAHAGSVRVGNPVEAGTSMGPVVSQAAADRITEQVDAAVKAGARALVGQSYGNRRRNAGRDAYLEPVVLTDVTHEMSIMRDETFGPVVPVMRVSSDAEAVSLMNDSVYGLTASIWSEDVDAAVALGSRIDTGTFFVNRCDHADVYLPCGGKKRSGLGKSLGPAPFDALTANKAYHVRKLG
jgi:acyl-CoA reductase-like NAD-dependent aldehyde dehydrogenase